MIYLSPFILRSGALIYLISGEESAYYCPSFGPFVPLHPYYTHIPPFGKGQVWV